MPYINYMKLISKPPERGPLFGGNAVVGVCETEQAISLVQERNRDLLKALSRERADLYRQIGEAFGARREALLTKTAATRGSAKPPAQSARSKHQTSKDREKEDA